MLVLRSRSCFFFLSANLQFFRVPKFSGSQLGLELPPLRRSTGVGTLGGETREPEDELTAYQLDTNRCIEIIRKQTCSDLGPSSLGATKWLRKVKGWKNSPFL